MSMNGYRCFACSTTQAVEYEAFLCPVCGGNLDISYDYDEVAARIDQGFSNGSNDLFRYAALLPLKQPRFSFPLRVGGTPLYLVQPIEEMNGMSGLYLKDETLNPSASLKDRASAVTIGRALDVGAGIVSVASTGNAGSSLACLAAANGLGAVVFVPASAPVAKLTQMLAFGANVLASNKNLFAAKRECNYE